MLFTSIDYLIFLTALFAVYWLVRIKHWQNLILLAGSYFFYGYIHPWFCLLIAFSTVLDYSCGLGMIRWPRWKRGFLILSLVGNLGMLGTFKYFNFFAENVQTALSGLGFEFHPMTFEIFLPVGISFYTFQTLSYTIDIYRGNFKPRTNFIDFAVFVSLFPQLVAGPVERAVRLLPQIESPRRWNWDLFASAWPLLIRGYMKKMVIADNVAIYVDKIFMLEHPTLLLLAVGSLAFAVQIYADFSGYTDIARGSAKLIGFNLMENFRSPYLAISPSDFWRRWHISFSSWIRDYLYIPLGGSRLAGRWRFALVLLTTMGLAGLWHGAAWNFVAWGIFHGTLVYAYHLLGMGGRWEPRHWQKKIVAWITMSFWTLIGWLLFRAPSLKWLLESLRGSADWNIDGQATTVAIVVLGLVGVYPIPLLVLLLLDRLTVKHAWAYALFYGLAVCAIFIFSRPGGQDFIYFQF